MPHASPHSELIHLCCFAPALQENSSLVYRWYWRMLCKCRVVLAWRPMRRELKGGGANLGPDLRSHTGMLYFHPTFSVGGKSVLLCCVIENKSFPDALTCPCIGHRLYHTSVLGQVFCVEVALLYTCCTGNLCICLRNCCTNS